MLTNWCLSGLRDPFLPQSLAIRIHFSSLLHKSFAVHVTIFSAFLLSTSRKLWRQEFLMQKRKLDGIRKDRWEHGNFTWSANVNPKDFWHQPEIQELQFEQKLHYERGNKSDDCITFQLHTNRWDPSHLFRLAVYTSLPSPPPPLKSLSRTVDVTHNRLARISLFQALHYAASN